MSFLRTVVYTVMPSIILLSSTIALFSMLSTAMFQPRANGALKGKVVIGYVQDYSDSPVNIDQIDFTKVTHLNVAFANPVDATGSISVPPNLSTLVSRAHQNGVEVLISIGGGGASTEEAGRQQYFKLISEPARSAFVQKLADYVEVNHLDGLDLDLEGPAINKDYTAFADDLAAALKPRGRLLTAAVSAWYGGDQITAEALGHFDLVNVMAYDATGPWDPSKPGQHSSLEYTKKAVSYWLDRGVPKSKIVVGVPFYGYGFGDAFTKDGYTYAQIVGKYPGSESSDQVGNTVWYNGIPTIRLKVKYVLDENFAGLMIWSIDQDVKGKQSLLAAIRDALARK